MGYDFVVVGAGMFGCSLARTLTDRGKKCLVVDKNDWIGGACETRKIEGVWVHMHGPHVFHTDDERIWDWIQKFGKFRQFTLRTKSFYKGKFYSLPPNLMTFHQFWGVSTPEEARLKLADVCVPCEKPETIEEAALAAVGPEIYDVLVKGYTTKQWGRQPKDLPANIFSRLPVNLTFQDDYFPGHFTGIPLEGYTVLLTRMLEGIEVKLGCDFLQSRADLERQGRVIYSGRMDEYFDYRLGQLEFRTCRFEMKVIDGDFQGNPIVNYPDAAVPFTRIVEYKHFLNPGNARSPIITEYPEECGRDGMPYYPINDAKNQGLCDKYRAIPTSTIFAGRLGKYRYHDMHQVIAQAWMLAERLTA
jgi:UDP-galactopyranose mutase